MINANELNIVKECEESTVNGWIGVTERERMFARIAATKALRLAGFSDENVPDSPRPLSNSPRNAGKNGEFGPTELR